MDDKVSLMITSYESGQPILAHIFYGDTIKDCFGAAKSHLLTDFFFSSTFVGKMEWRDGELMLSYDAKVYGVKRFPRKQLEKLEREAAEINDSQVDAGMTELIAKLSK